MVAFLWDVGFQNIWSGLFLPIFFLVWVFRRLFNRVFDGSVVKFYNVNSAFREHRNFGGKSMGNGRSEGKWKNGSNGIEFTGKTFLSTQCRRLLLHARLLWECTLSSVENTDWGDIVGSTSENAFHLARFFPVIVRFSLFFLMHFFTSFMGLGW